MYRAIRDTIVLVLLLLVVVYFRLETVRAIGRVKRVREPPPEPRGRPQRGRARAEAVALCVLRLLVVLGAAMRRRLEEGHHGLPVGTRLHRPHRLHEGVQGLQAAVDGVWARHGG